jgi:hypothetical protein
MITTPRRIAKIIAATAVVPATLLITGTTIAAASHTGAGAEGRDHAIRHVTAPPLRVRQVLNGMKLRHAFVPAGSASRRVEPLTLPDDITVLGHHVFAGFQNGVGPQGQASAGGNLDSTIVEFTAAGRVLRQWDIKGKCDGLTADASARLLLATVNEDASSSVYAITPGAAAGSQVQHYRYSKPLPHKGGTDAISIYRGRVLISASAPGTTGQAAPQPAYPAAYSVTFNRADHVASVSALFNDEARTTIANLGAGHGRVVRLALTDPDSNEIVPGSAPRFAGDFMLTSQGDKEQIFVHDTRLRQRLSVLRLSGLITNPVWVTHPCGLLYGADNSADTIVVVTGRFRARSVLVAVTPCDAASAPATCPAPGFAPNYLGSLNPWTGHITRVALRGAAFEPHGLVFVSPGWVTTPG